MQNGKFFFSYSRKDSAFVKKLANDLKATGANVWLDQLDIGAGVNWDEAIQKALNESNGLMLVLSPSSVESENVLDEASFALDQGKQIVPLLIEPCTVPFRFARKQYIDFTADYNTGFQNLLLALQRKEEAVQPGDKLQGTKPLTGSVPKTAFWHSASGKIGLVAGLLGIALSIAAAVKIFTPGEQKSIENKEAKLRMNNLEPKIESSYVLMAQDTYFFTESDSAGKTGSLYFLNYPLLKNEIAFETGDGQMQLAEIFDDTGMVRVTYLVLQNNGQSVPQDLQVVLKRYVLKDKVTVEEIPGAAGAGYEAAVRANATDSAVRTFNPPTVLETGKGIRIPLFLESEYYSANRNGTHKWSLVSKIIYLPNKLIYTDPFDDTKKEIKIRSMKDPVKIATGIEGRG